MFTSRFVPGATAEQLDWFNELCRRTTSPENAAALLETRAGVDVRALLGAAPRNLIGTDAISVSASPLQGGEAVLFSNCRWPTGGSQ